jgi:hypothetical protein
LNSNIPSFTSSPPKPKLLLRANNSWEPMRKLPSYLQPRENFPLAPLPPSDQLLSSTQPPAAAGIRYQPKHTQASATSMTIQAEMGSRR